MNEFILGLAGFTPQEWREFKGRLANKILFYWQRISKELTLERIRAGFFVLLIAGLGLFGVQRGIKYLAQRNRYDGEQGEESTRSAEPRKKEELEVILEGIDKDLETVMNPPADLEYPPLDLGVSFE